MVIEQRGRHFDPVLVDAFEARYEDILARQVELHAQGGDAMSQYAKVLSLTQALDDADLVGTTLP